MLSRRTPSVRVSGRAEFHLGRMSPYRVDTRVALGTRHGPIGVQDLKTRNHWWETMGKLLTERGVSEDSVLP